MTRAAQTIAVVYDLDGTLVDSMPLVLRAFAYALHPARGEMTSDDILAHLGGPPERTFQSLISNETQVAEAMTRLRDFSLKHWRQIRPFAGMHAHLDHLMAAKRQLAVWTGRERESTEWLLRENGIGPKLSAYVCGDDLPTHKPHPGGLAETLRKLSVNRDEALFVGDADVDVLAGAELGVRTLLITHDRIVTPAVQGKAWLTVTTPAEAYAAVQVECARSR